MIVIGTHSDATKTGLVAVAKSDLLYHTAIIGQSGSGKSFAIARLLEEIILRTRARIVVLDPNHDFSTFHKSQKAEFWSDHDTALTFKNINKRMPAGIVSYDKENDFNEKWQKKTFQFLSPEKKDRTPYTSNAFAAPLRIHWKFLDDERDFLLQVDATQYPKINQGISSCYKYVDSNKDDFPEQYSLRDLEKAALDFALKRIVVADYPEALTLDEMDWTAVRLQFRHLRKRYFRLFFQTSLWREKKAPSDLVNYIHRGFKPESPWQTCVVGLAGLGVDHMHLAANVALFKLWRTALDAWREARGNAAMESQDSFPGSIPGESDAEADADASDLDEDAEAKSAAPLGLSGDGGDQRVPTFIVIDEAHNFAPQEPASPLQARVSDRIATIAAEGRKYGLFLILATQRPQKLRRGLLAECENSCLLRIQSKVERVYAAEALGMPPDLVEQQVAQSQVRGGQALMHGRWVTSTQACSFAPSRTMLGGGGLNKTYWQNPD